VRRLRRDRSGQSLVEFALASTVFFLTIFGILELGFAVWRYNMIADLAQEGARRAAVGGPGGGSLRAHEADIQAFVQSRANGIAVTVETTSEGSVVDGPYNVAAGNPITVRVRGSYTPLSGFIGRAATIPLTADATMIVNR
jgi:Flp pilus assembly protein TadG